MESWKINTPHIELYSDGSADPNPGKGGYGLILRYAGKSKEFAEGFELTTNNRMELLGVISGLEKLKTRSIVEVYTDSSYVVDSITKGWVFSWKMKGWRKADKKPVINVDLWERLLPLLEKHEVLFHWLKGHAGHPENERCDELAKAARGNGNVLAKDFGYSSAISLSNNPSLF
ncbi:MAG: ribonuclease HI [Bacteroidales bacterium]|nr:ribonuclease HI [Bacteroidales bacterium]